MRVSAARALGFRLARHGLEAPADEPVAETVRRLVALRAWPEEGAQLSLRVRRSRGALGDLDRALASGTVVRAYAFRGGSYLFTPEAADVLLRVRTATRVWETARWQRQASFRLDDWEPFRSAMRSILADGPLTREEIAARLHGRRGLPDLTVAARGAGADALYKPLHWWGDLCFGPERDGQATFQLRPPPDAPLDLDEAGRDAVRLYLSAYGPAPLDNLQYWLGAGLGAPRRRLAAWVDELETELVRVRVDDQEALLLADDLPELEGARASSTVRLLPAHDPWVLGPGTADATIVTPARRSSMSQGRSPVLLRARVAGTWRLEPGRVLVSWFPESGRVPRTGLERERVRMGELLGDELALEVEDE